MEVRQLARKAAVTVTEDATVHDVADLMNRTVVGAVVVTRDDRPVGIVTDRDLVVRVLAHWEPPGTPVREVMTPDPVTLEAGADAHQAVRLFEHHGFRRLPVVEHGKLVGMLTVDDLIIDLVSDLTLATRPITGQVVFGAPEAEPVVNP